MPEQLLFDWQLEKAIANASDVKFTPRWIPVPDVRMRVYMELSAATRDLLDRDPLLHQIIVDLCRASFVDVLREIVPKLQQLDAECGKKGTDLAAYAQLRKKVLRLVDLEIDEARRRAMKAIERKWTQIQKNKQEYKSYRLGVAIKVVKGAAGLVAAGVGIAGAAPTGGASLALAVVGGYQAMVSGVRTLYEAWLSAEETRDGIVKDLQSLRATYAKSQSAGVAREVAASTASAIFGVPAANVAKLESRSKLWHGKLSHLRFLAHELAEELNALLVKADKLSRELDGAKQAKQKKALEGVEQDVNLLLTEGFFVPSMGKRVRIQDAHQKAEAGLQAQQQVDAAIAALKAKRSVAVDLFDKIISYVVDTALFVAGSVVDAPSKAIDIVLTSKDALLNGATLFEMVADEMPKTDSTQTSWWQKFKVTVTNAIFGEAVAPPSAPSLAGSGRP